MSADIGDETVDGAADGFRRRGQEEMLGGGIEHGDRELLIEEDDGVHGRADDAGQASLGFGEGFLGLLALGEVACDLDEAAEGTFGVAEGGDDDVGPEGSTVFADAPALIFEAAEPLGFHQLAVGEAAQRDLLWVKDREMFADDLRCLVALHPLGPFVPGNDVAGGV